MTSFCRQWPRSFSPLPLALASWLLLSCGGGTSVMRARGSEQHAGRPISPSAYSYYLAAINEEGHGQVERAERLFLSAVKEDPESGASWAGLVRTGCHRSRNHVDQVLSSARSAADRPALALSDYAECLIRPFYPHPGPDSARLKDAEHAIRVALAEEPLLESATLALIKIQLQNGKPKDAVRTQRAFEIYAGYPISGELRSKRIATLSQVDQMIFDGRVAQGMDASLELMTSGEFSLRLLALGFPEEAHTLAESILINDPSNPNAKLARALSLRPAFYGVPDPLLEEELGRVDELTTLGRLLYLFELRRIQPRLADQLYQELELGGLITSDPLVDWWRHEYMSQ